MKTEMKVLLYLKKSEQDSDNLCPVMGKITVRGDKNTYVQFASKIKANPDLWNATSQRCTGKSRESVKINREIESLLLLIRLRFNELIDYNSNVTAQDVKNSFQGITAAQTTLLKVFQEHNEEYALRVGVNRAATTYYQYKNTYRLLSLFIEDKYKVSDVAVKSLDFSFIEAFNSWLRITEKQKPATILGHINRLKSITFTAIYRGIISVNPFEGFTPERPERKQLHLTSDEFSKLMNTTFDTPNRNFTRDIFLFASFTGLSYCDICKLSYNEIVRDNDGNLWIETNRKKTGTAENVMLMDIAVRIIEKYKGTAKDGKVFPMLLNTSINPHLKKMAKQCGIERNLTFHMSRHTFASLVCLQYGVPIETVSKAMGHKNITTTQRYAKVTHEKIDRDVTMLRDNFENKYTLQGIDAPPSTILKDMSRRKVRPSRKLQNIGGL